MSFKEAASEDKQTDFNAAIATLKRIDEIKKGLIVATINEGVGIQYLSKFRYLKAFFFELVSIMDEEDDKKQQDRFKQVRIHYDELKKALREGARTVSTKVIDSFDDWEIELRNIEQRYGMNMPKKADPRYAMAGGR